MRMIYSLAAVVVTLLAAPTAKAQLQGPAGRAVGEAAQAPNIAADRAGVTVQNEQQRLAGSTDPEAHLGQNPDDARFNDSAAAIESAPNANVNPRVNAIAPDANINARVNAQASIQPNHPERWRYVQHNNQWWYYTPNKSWMYHHNNAWNHYDAATYASPRYSMGYRGYNNQYDNRRFNYAPGVRARANLNGAAAVNSPVPRTGAGVRSDGTGGVMGARSGEPVRSAAEKAEGVLPGDAGSAIGRP